jgi:hypothetical protein
MLIVHQQLTNIQNKVFATTGLYSERLSDGSEVFNVVTTIGSLRFENGSATDMNSGVKLYTLTSQSLLKCFHDCEIDHL